LCARFRILSVMKTAAVCVFAALALVGAGCGASTKVTATCPGGYAVGSRPSVAHPLVCARRTTLANASAALGRRVVLPHSALVRPSDAGPVWMVHSGKPSAGITNVAVTFPSRRVIVEYERPAPSNGSAAHFRAMAAGINDAQVVRLGGRVPALAVKQNSDMTRKNFGTIIFNVGGSEVRVMGHYSRGTLQRVAQSVLEGSSS